MLVENSAASSLQTMFRHGLLLALLLTCAGCEKPAAPPPAASQTAPEGVFYTMTATQVKSAQGPVQIPPATLLLRTGPNTYRTTEGTTLTLAPSQVTNDLTVLRHIQKAGREARFAAEKREWERKAAEEARIAAEQARATPPATPRPWGTLLDQKSYDNRRGVAATPVLRR